MIIFMRVHEERNEVRIPEISLGAAGKKRPGKTA
jgi:hypothetical protein